MQLMDCPRLKWWSVAIEPEINMHVTKISGPETGQGFLATQQKKRKRKKELAHRMIAACRPALCGPHIAQHTTWIVFRVALHRLTHLVSVDGTVSPKIMVCLSAGKLD